MLALAFGIGPVEGHPQRLPNRHDFLQPLPSFDFDILASIKQAAAMAKSPLGRGLSALLSGNHPAPTEVAGQTDPTTPSSAAPGTTESASKGGSLELSMDQIRPCSFQPRKDFDDAALQDLAASIKSQGILQPLVVRPAADGYELIAGERRWRAAQIAGLSRVPALIREADDREVIELALVENLQRENLNPIEEALGYQQLIDQFKLRQDEAAQKVGKSRAAVTNALRLLKLPEKAQVLLKDGEISVGHAKVILGLTDDTLRTSIANQVAKDHLSVRETEQLISRLQAQSQTPTSDPRQGPAKSPKDPHLSRLQEKVCQRYGTKVTLKYQEGKGAIELKFFSDEDLERIIQLLGIERD